MRKLLYTAAHGGFSAEAAPLGGGAAVCDHLVDEWTRTRPFSLQLITPAILNSGASRGASLKARDLVSFDERTYARFCRDFECAATEELLRRDPGETVVLSNDVSEGPDFSALAARGFRVFTIYHVDVVAYVAAIYGHDLVRPETTVRWYRRLRPLLPGITRLIWEKQEASVRHSRGLIVPSDGMKDVLLRCYPECPPDKIHVLPWGSWDATSPGSLGSTASSSPSAEFLRAEYGVPANAKILLTLSRISPEKGQDLLLRTLIEWERRDDFPQQPVWLFVCGGAAYMQGVRYLETLKVLASRLRRTRVVFPGHVTGDHKRAFFSLADLYIFPSRHESYGLTLMEALAAGVPAVCLDHHGSRSVMKGDSDFGVLVQSSELRPAIARLLADEPLRLKMSAAARTYAQSQRFSDCASDLANLLLQDFE